jgi:hypothetical protein
MIPDNEFALFPTCDPACVNCLAADLPPEESSIVHLQTQHLDDSQDWGAIRSRRAELVVETSRRENILRAAE